MMKIKNAFRTLACAIAVFLPLLLMLPIFSCGNVAEDESVESPSGRPGTGNGAAEITDAPNALTADKLLPKLDGRDFGGYEFHFFVRGEHAAEWQSKDIHAEEENGDPINDAIYRRNINIEDRYGITIKEIRSTDATEAAAAVKRTIDSGDTPYDALSYHFSKLSSLIDGGYLLNLYEVPNLDLGAPWWDKAAERDLSLNHKLYATTGDIGILPASGSYILLFNKKLVADYGFEDPYLLVAENKWTLDKMTQMVRQVSKDLDGDGAPGPGDLYGMVCMGNNISMMYHGAGQNVVEKDDNDLPKLVVDTPRSIMALERTLELLSDKHTVLLSNEWSAGATGGLTGPALIQNIFEENRALFMGEVLQLVARMRASDVDFGILPHPKLDESQDKYYSKASHNASSMICIPVTNPDPERTGFVLEALCAESMYTLTPAFYDITLEGKYLRDQESSAMLDIILRNRMFAIDQMYDWGMIAAINGLYEKRGTTAIVSTIERAKPAVQARMDKTIEVHSNSN